MGRFVKALVWAAVVFGAAFFGCTKRDDGGGPAEPSEPAAGQPSQKGAAVTAPAGAFDEALKLWRDGDQRGAAERLLRMDWPNAAIFAEESVFRISEAAFVKLPAERRSAVQEEAMAATKAVREMARYVIEEGRRLAAQGQDAAARSHYDAVARCGEVLAGEDRLALVKMVGEALEKYAAAQTGN
ncbi:MAG: hypothetical protein IH624_11240 [Phycisphaerae bacterium]|nr:hypothetical protein [Phycisphaerae bacterium]